MDRTVEISAFPEISITNDNPDFHVQLTLLRLEGQIYTYRFLVESVVVAQPQAISLRWKIPAINVKGVWKSGALHNKRLQYDWELDHCSSRISVDAPVISVFGHDDRNVVTFACSDAVNLLEMNALLREEDNHLYCHLTFFSERHPAITAYEAELKINTKQQLYAEALQEISDWWAQSDLLTPTHVPAIAKTPLYSTWYSFHQSLTEDAILKECSIAVQMGMGLVIVDDGWQTMDNNRGYDYTGDWLPKRLTQLAGLVEQVHALGMKFGILVFCAFLWKKIPSLPSLQR